MAPTIQEIYTDKVRSTLRDGVQKDYKRWIAANANLLQDSSSSFGLPNLLHLDEMDGQFLKIFGSYLSTNHLQPIPKVVLFDVNLGDRKVPVYAIDFPKLGKKVEYRNSVACELPVYEDLEKCAKRAKATSSTLMDFVSRSFYSSKVDRDTDFKTGSWDHGLEMGHCFHSWCAVHSPPVNVLGNLMMESRQLNQFDEKCMKMIRPHMKGKNMGYQHKFTMIFEQQAVGGKGREEFLVPYVTKKTLTLLVQAVAKDGKGPYAHLWSIEIARNISWKKYKDDKVNKEEAQIQEPNVEHLRQVVKDDMQLLLGRILLEMGKMTPDQMSHWVQARDEELRGGKRHRLRMQVTKEEYRRGTTNPQLQKDGQNPGPKKDFYKLNDAVICRFEDMYDEDRFKDQEPNWETIYGYGRGSTIFALQPCPPGTDLKTHITSVLGPEWGKKEPLETYNMKRRTLEELRQDLRMGRSLELKGLSFNIECLEGCPWTLVINKLELSEKSIKVENAMVLGSKLGLVLSGTMTCEGESPSFSLKVSCPEFSISFGDICEVFGLFALPVGDLLTIERPSLFMASEGELYDCKETGIHLMGPLIGGTAIFTLNVPGLFKWSGEAGFVYQTHSVLVEAEEEEDVNPLMMKAKILMVSVRPHMVVLHFPQSAPLSIHLPPLGEVKVSALSLAAGVCSFAGVTLSSLKGVLVDFVSFDIKQKEFRIDLTIERDDFDLFAAFKEKLHLPAPLHFENGDLVVITSEYAKSSFSAMVTFARPRSRDIPLLGQVSFGEVQVSEKRLRFGAVESDQFQGSFSIPTRELVLTTKKDLALNHILPEIPLSFTVMQGAQLQYLPESGASLTGNFQIKGQNVQASLVHCSGGWHLTLFPRDSFTVRPVLDLFPNLAHFPGVSDVASRVSFKEVRLSYKDKLMVSAKPELGSLVSGAVGGLLGIFGVDTKKIELYSEPTWGFGLQEVFTIDNLPQPFKDETTVRLGTAIEHRKIRFQVSIETQFDILSETCPIKLSVAVEQGSTAPSVAFEFAVANFRPRLVPMLEVKLGMVKAQFELQQQRVTQISALLDGKLFGQNCKVVYIDMGLDTNTGKLARCFSADVQLSLSNLLQSMSCSATLPVDISLDSKVTFATQNITWEGQHFRRGFFLKSTNKLLGLQSRTECELDLHNPKDIKCKASMEVNTEELDKLRQKLLEAIKRELSAAREKISGAREKANRDVRNAEREVANERRRAAEAREKIRREREEHIRNARREMEKAEREVAGPRRALNDAQDKVDGLRREIRSCERADWYEIHRKLEIPALEAAILVAKGALEVAKAPFHAAEATLKGAKEAYHRAAEGAMYAAEGSTYVYDGAMYTAEGTLIAARETASAVLKVAEEATKVVEKLAEAILSPSTFSIRSMKGSISADKCNVKFSFAIHLVVAGKTVSVAFEVNLNISALVKAILEPVLKEVRDAVAKL